MKKLYSFKSLIILLFVSSFLCCEKDPVDSKILLIGVWDQLSIKTITYYDNVKQNESLKTYDPGYNVLEIYENGTAKRFIDGKMSDEFYWKVESDIFTMTGSNGTVINTIFEVSETDLNITWAVEESTDGHLLRTDYSSVYKKQ